MCKRKRNQKPLRSTDDEELEYLDEEIREYDNSTLERLKIRYDILKQGVVQQNKILQMLLGLVATFIGVFEITLCLCNDATLSWVDIAVSVLGIGIFIWAMICVIGGLCCSNDKNLIRNIQRAQKLWDLRDFIRYYSCRICNFRRVLKTKKAFVKQAKIPTIILGVCALIYEIAMLVMNIISLLG